MQLRYKLLMYGEFGLGIVFYPLILLIATLAEIFQWIIQSKTPKNISDEIAVVTGGAHGLGREICFSLANEGCHIAVVDINIEGAEETAQLIQQLCQVKAIAYKVDVTSFDQVMELKQKVSKDLGTATILVNCAGILMLSKYPNPDYREVQRMINVNLTSHFWTLDAFLPKMKELQKGHIVAISSIAGCFPLVYNSQYTATKFGVRGLMKTLRQELLLDKVKGVYATTVFPYFLTTNTFVAEAYQKSEFSDRYGITTGADAAKAIVDGMLRNERDIMIPSVLGLFYRLYEGLPAWWQDKILQLRTKDVTPDLWMNQNQ